MKACPECGEKMRLGAGQWLHIKPGICRTISLRATPEEVSRHTRRGGKATMYEPTESGAWRFRYLQTDGPPVTGAE